MRQTLHFAMIGAGLGVLFHIVGTVSTLVFLDSTNKYLLGGYFVTYDLALLLDSQKLHTIAFSQLVAAFALCGAAIGSIKTVFFDKL